MTTERAKVLYIGGAGRSGSTILNNILGQVKGFFATGEFSLIWNWGLIENRICGCGRPFRECDVWQRVFQKAFGGFDQVDAEQMFNYKSLVNSKNYLKHIAYTLAITTRRRRNRPDLVEYGETINKLYKGLHDATGCHVIVDSSKRPAYGYLLWNQPDVDMYVLHLVRDSRGVRFSHARKKYDHTRERQMLQPGSILTSIEWSFWNMATEWMWGLQHRQRYMRLRYEDFVREPEKHLKAIVHFVGESEELVPPVVNNTIEIHPTHTVAGNPVRTNTGPVQLITDAEWMSAMPWLDRTILTALTWPLLLHYGYPLFPRP